LDFMDSVQLRAGGIVLRVSDSGLVEVLLVSRRSTSNSYTLPAGKYEFELDHGRLDFCALRETMEEAGVNCKIMFDLGWYARPAQEAHKRSTRTRFYAMRYVAESSDWLEGEARHRQWQPLRQALESTRHNAMLTCVLQQLQQSLEDAEFAISDDAFSSGCILSAVEAC